VKNSAKVPLYSELAIWLSDLCSV